jgi:hypothetical protein
LKTEKYELLPIESSIVGLLCSISWFTYSFLDKFDINITIPNGLGNLILLIKIGIIFSVINIVVWVYYYKKAKDMRPHFEKFMSQDEKISSGRI